VSAKSGELDPKKKHRHDVGAVDHGPTSTERTTRAIQLVMGLAILLSAALLVYALLAGWLEISAG
jgi:hypothetical protein